MRDQITTEHREVCNVTGSIEFGLRVSKCRPAAELGETRSPARGDLWRERRTQPCPSASVLFSLRGVKGEASQTIIVVDDNQRVLPALREWSPEEASSRLRPVVLLRLYRW